MKNLILIITSILIALCVPAFAETVQEATQSAISLGVSTLLVNVVIPLLAGLFLTVGTIAINKLRVKYKLDNAGKLDDILYAAAKRGVAMAEEYAESYAKSKPDMKLTGNQKLDIAIGHVLQTVPKVSVERAEQMVHAAIAGTSGVGATGDKTIGNQ